MVASQVRGELALIKLVVTVFGLPVTGSIQSSPNRILHISTVSSARVGWVTEPMKGLSE